MDLFEYIGGSNMNRLDYLFLSKVLINLLFQSGITSITAYNNQNQTIPNKWIYVIISFLLIFLLGYLSSNNSSFYLRFILLVTLSYVNGIIFSGIVIHIPDKEIK